MEKKGKRRRQNEDVDTDRADFYPDGKDGRADSLFGRNTQKLNLAVIIL